jgi:hypothetical protein
MEQEYDYIEQEEAALESQEGVSSREALSVWSELQAKLVYAGEIGVMTTRETKQWEQGFWACDRLEHMQNLAEMVDDYIGEGEALLRTLDDLLDHELITYAEKSAWMDYVGSLSFVAKSEKVAYFQGIRSRLGQLKTQFEVSSAKLNPALRAALWNRFVEASIKQKDEVVKEAARLARESLQVVPEPEALTVQEVAELAEGGDFIAAERAIRQTPMPVFAKLQMIQTLDLRKAQHQTDQAFAA